MIIEELAKLYVGVKVEQKDFNGILQIKEIFNSESMGIFFYLKYTNGSESYSVTLLKMLQDYEIVL